MNNKNSVWAKLILAISILMVVSIVVSIVLLAVQLPGIRAVAEEELIRQGVSQDIAKAAVDTAMSSVITGVVLGITFNIFEAIGGFLFSLKGKWGMFCVVVSIIVLVADSIRILTGLVQQGDLTTIILNFLDLILAVLFCVACVKHRKENQELALEEAKAN